MIDMTNDPHKGPEPLQFEGSYLTDNPEFNPHGISHWITEKGKILIYVVCHWNDKDSIDVFQYYPEKKSVKYIRSISDDSAVELNNLIVLSEEEFYVTNSRYFTSHLFGTLEQLFRLPLTKVYYVRDGEFRVVGSGFKGANGINVSRNKQLVDS